VLTDFIATLYQLLHGIQDSAAFEDKIYPQSMAALAFWGLVVAAAYYYLLGWFSAEFNMRRHWFLALILNCILSMLTVVAICRFDSGTWGMAPPSVTLVLIQGLYAAALFLILTLIMKWGSPNARRTPW
jgi:predicted neutral ceramidase superfamily lipid hydrolase